MATLLERPRVQFPGTPTVNESRVPARVAPAAPVASGEIGDRQAGYIAVGVIAGVGLLMVTLIITIAIYSMTWGYEFYL
jgi:hypothetical protein